jgi:hypothetical protein
LVDIVPAITTALLAPAELMTTFCVAPDVVGTGETVMLPPPPA